MKRLFSFVMVVIVSVALLISLNMKTASAQESMKSQEEAGKWLTAQDGKAYDFGNFYDANGNYWYEDKNE